MSCPVDHRAARKRNQDNEAADHVQFFRRLLTMPTGSAMMWGEGSRQQPEKENRNVAQPVQHQAPDTPAGV